MALFHKKPNVITDRARALSNEIAALEAEIKKLEMEKLPAEPRPRSAPQSPFAAPSPPASPVAPAVQAAPVLPPGQTREPIFEKVNQRLIDAHPEPGDTSDHFNELGVRKYDLPALLSRFRNHFKGPSTSNPKLVSYLAAGGIQGLRPMRYEKRVARNRLIWMSLFLFALTLGVLRMVFRNPR